MAASCSTWDEEVARWGRVGELGMEAALREIGCSEARLSNALKQNNKIFVKSMDFQRKTNVVEAGFPTSSSSMSDRAHSGDEGHGDEGDSQADSYTELERSTIFATVGRGTSRVDHVHLTDATENEATALCVNLTTNTNIETLSVFSNDAFGSPTGCTLLGNAFATNRVIKKFFLKKSLVGREGVRCLMRGLQLTKAVEFLDLSCNALGDDGVSLVAEYLANAPLVRILWLGEVRVHTEGVTCLVKSLQLMSKTLERLDLSRNPLGDDGVRLVAEYLANNTTLTHLALNSVGCCLEGAKHMSSALIHNTRLEKLDFGIFYEDSSYDKNLLSDESQYLEEDASVRANLVEGYRVILESLSLDAEDAPLAQSAAKNSTLRSLCLRLPDVLKGEDPTYLKLLTSVIKRNRSLRYLHFWNFKLPPEAWKEQFFPSLKENATLQQLGLSGCEGLSEDVFEALMDVVQSSNTALEQIDLLGTGLQDKRPQVNEELRINNDYRSTLRGQPMVPTTSGRLVLCGFGFGGKTEICKTMQRIDKSAALLHLFKIGWDNLMQIFPALQRSLIGEDAYQELGRRTRGCEISTLQNQLPLKSIWDFAGQEEYYALHDYLFPDMKNSCFLFVCSCRDPPDPDHPRGKIKDKETMRDNCEYWMKFLASNSKVYFGKDSQERQLPCVVFVLTKRDTLTPLELNISKANANSVVKDLREVFGGVVDLYEKVEVVDARNADDIKDLLKLVQDVLGRTLENEREYEVCQNVRDVLGRWSAQNESKPVLQLDEYYKLCQDQIKPLNPLVSMSEGQRHVRAGRDVVLAYLNDLGEVISLKGLGFIVTNPRWFGVGVLGSLINAFKSTEDRTGLLTCCLPLLDFSDPPKHEGGFVERGTMKALLEHSLQTMHLNQPLTPNQLTDLMIELEMCYKKDPNDEESQLFLPALFDDVKDVAAQGIRQLVWKLERNSGQSQHLVYLGRRLNCKDRSKTFLTPGFFPRWQVHMLNFIHVNKWVSNLAFQIGRNMIGFAEDGVEVLVEYSGDIDYFVDVLVRASKPYAQALEFIETHVLQNIRQFCASPQGCQGVVLETFVIRPVCVRELHLCIHRKHQSILISHLQSKLALDRGYEHTWRKKLGQGSRQRREWESDIAYALDLLEGEGSFTREFTSKGESQVDRNLQDIASSFTSSSSRGHDLPKLIYPSIDNVGKLQKIATGLNLRKKIAFKVHLLCDNKDGWHEVEKQPGRSYVLNWRDGDFDLPIAKDFVTLVYSAMGAAAHFPLPSIDNWVKSFDAPEMPAMDVETLHQLMNPTTALAPVSKKHICVVLTRYMERDPHALGMQEFLKLEESKKFWDHFQLRKVVYKKAPHQDKIGWVCDRCYSEGLDEGILASISLT